ncbi:MAG: hypothetical protein C0525_01290 [Flavobacterium sp.]|uniref:hypothetical protein n=1 Tax=Flavobacterium sp. TaxID=239 RepID=UPI0025BA71E6|nr:hypothetical protein [Flavobacterium sp.]MBA4133335.1 hypothetical protein [Flavobacterium sp.]
MRHIVDINGFYRGIATEKTILKEGEKEVPFPPDESFLKAQWNGETYIEAAEEEEILNNREVPQLVPLWCIKVILHEMGLLATVEMELSKLPEPMKTRASYIWEYGNQIDRKSQTVAFIGAVLQKDKIDIDDIFINADKIEL